MRGAILAALLAGACAPVTFTGGASFTAEHGLGGGGAIPGLHAGLEMAGTRLRSEAIARAEMVRKGDPPGGWGAGVSALALIRAGSVWLGGGLATFEHSVTGGSTRPLAAIEWQGVRLTYQAPDDTHHRARHVTLSVRRYEGDKFRLEPYASWSRFDGDRTGYSAGVRATWRRPYSRRPQREK